MSGQTSGSNMAQGILRWLLSLSLWLGVGTVAAPAHAATVEYIHTDAQGTVVAVSNAAGAIIARREYEPYGKQLQPTTLSDGPGYTGHVMDAATGLVQMQQRYYDPNIGRFLSVDPVTANVSAGGNFNRYWYANNNPYKFADPDGRCSRITGSMICDGSAGLASMARTANLPKQITKSMVRSEGPNEASRAQINTVVDDANTAGRTAAMAGDSRAVKAFNKIDGIVIDSSDWSSGSATGERLPESSIAYARYGGGKTGSIVVNAARYFPSDAFRRVSRILHEVYHLDSEFDAEKVAAQNSCKSSCAGWDFRFEVRVEVQAMKTMRAGWANATMPDEP